MLNQVTVAKFATELYDPVKNVHIVECRYNAVQYDRILSSSLQWLMQNINKNLEPQNTPHSWPVRARYGVYFVVPSFAFPEDFGKNWPHYNGMHCM